nr:sigma factor [Lysobacter enzymogenes]
MSPHELDQALREQLPSLRRFARWLARDPHAADDLVQSALERAIAGWSQRRDEAALRPWLFSILYRQFLDGQRRAQRYAACSRASAWARPTASPPPSAKRSRARPWKRCNGCRWSSAACCCGCRWKA